MMRDHMIQFFYINYRNIKNNIYPYVTMLIAMIGAHNKWEPYIYTGFIAISVFLIVKSFYTWKNKTFVFHDEFVSVSSGIWRKSYQDIHYTKIKSLHTNHPFFKRLVGISDLTVETVGGEKISFVLSNQEVNRIKSVLRAEEKQETNKKRSFRFSFFDYMMISFSSPKTFWTSLPIATMFLSQVSSFMINRDEAEQQKQQEIEERGMMGTFEVLKEAIFPLTFDMIMSVLIVIGIIFVCAYIVSVGLTYMKYRKFSIIREQNELVIEYGLFQKKVYTITVPDIRAIEVLQPAVYRVFGYAKLKVQSISLEGEESKTLFFLPIVKMRDLEATMEQYVPEIEVPQNIVGSPSSALLFFIGRDIVWCSALFAALTYLFHPLYYLFYSLPFVCYMGYTRWRYNGISLCEKFISIQTVSWGTVKHIVFRKEFLQSKGWSQWKGQEKFSLCDYDFSVYSEKVHDSFSVPHISKEFKDTFMEK